jgi:monothiol glutaredoxin
MSEDFDKDAVIKTIKEQIDGNPVLLYMKGSPDALQCGFSMKAVKMLSACDVAFAYVDILQQPEFRATLPEVAEWPTFPQLYIGGELIGGSDIIEEMFEDGELQEKLDAVSIDTSEDNKD